MVRSDAKTLVMLKNFFRLCYYFLPSLAISLAATGHAEVLVHRTPDEGLQPRLIQGAGGSVHLLYFKKRLDQPAAREGNLYYRSYLPEQNRFGATVKVSSQAFNLQTVAISRAAMAIDGAGRLHVMWYVAEEEQYFYTRSNLERTQFESQRALASTFRDGLDAGGDVAAMGSSVAVVWGAGALSREAERTMVARFSADGGASFGEELRISDSQLGACACCSMAVEFLSPDSLTVAYRSAVDGSGRHMQVLTAAGMFDHSLSWQYRSVGALQEWEATYCPLSTNDIASDRSAQPWLVFETMGRVVQMSFGESTKPSRVGEPFTETRQKNPAVAFNHQGDRLIAWGESVSHSRGGRLNLRIYTAGGVETDFRLAEQVQIANFSFPAVAALPDGNFLVLH